MAIESLLTTLGYVVRGDQVLLCHRLRADDHQVGKYNGVGGKVEREEDVAAGMLRELREETGLEATSLTLRGTISWPGFGRDGEDIFGFVFLVRIADDAVVPDRNDEGTLAWHPIEAIMDLPVWDGDRYFLPLVFDDDPRAFHMVIPYADGRSTGMSVTRL